MDSLNSHAMGRRSGDQFCVYVCGRFVVPRLTSAQQAEVGDGRLSLDALTRTTSTTTSHTDTWLSATVRMRSRWNGTYKEGRWA